MRIQTGEAVPAPSLKVNTEEVAACEANVANGAEAIAASSEAVNAENSEAVNVANSVAVEAVALVVQLKIGRVPAS